VPHRLAELAVAWHGDAGLLLETHDLGDTRSELVLEAALVRRHAGFARAIGLDQIVRAREASGVARQDLIAALPHDASSISLGEVSGVYSIAGWCALAQPAM
jgi:hypothetical protein